MSNLFAGGQTPTDLRIRKVGECEYIVDFLDYRPEQMPQNHPGAPCGGLRVLSRAFTSIESALDFVSTYLEAGEYCYHELRR